MEINLALEHYKVLLNWYELLFADGKRQPSEIEVDCLSLITQMLKQEIRNFENLGIDKN